jgi:hypothetical protein
MARYFAEVDASNTVVRVVVADSPEWCAENLGGTWVEAGDPYDPARTVAYPGPGHGHDAAWGRRFGPPWTRPTGFDEDTGDLIGGYSRGDVVWDGTRLIVSMLNNNVLAPDEGGWYTVPVDLVSEIPTSTTKIVRWSNNTNYAVNDVAYDQTGAYRCVTAHRSSGQVRLSSNNWVLIISRDQVV